jgi:hypothetical protein
MKSIIVGLILGIAASLNAAQCNWDCLMLRVKSGEITFEKAREIALKYESDVKEAQAFSQAGDFISAEAVTPITWVKAWYALNDLRVSMGGVREGRNWTTYDYKMDETEKASCRVKASHVLSLVKTAREEGIDGKGSLSVDNVEDYVNKYLNGILK